MLKKISILGLLLTCFNLAVIAQEKPAMADAMRSNGKIYVVVAVILLLFAGLIVYLLRLDKKISRLEKENQG